MDYFEFVKDPVSEVEGIYRHFGIEFTDAARTAIDDSHTESQKGPRAPKHTYSLADYGLTDEQVKERFKGCDSVRPSYWPASQCVSARPGPGEHG